MTATATHPATTSGSGTRRHPVLRATVLVGIAAAVVVTAASAALHGAGVGFAVDGEMIPLAGFAQMTFLGAALGGLLLAGLNRRSSAPRRRFLQVTAALTLATCIPSIALPQGAGTKVALVALHLLAAAIIVPVLARLAND